jgi:uncharacterized Tic20 family protein
MFENQYETVTQDEKTFGMLAHLLGIISFIGPLVIWLIKKDQSSFVNENAKTALNFQLTILIAFLIGGVLQLILIGFLINGILTVLNIILCVVNGMRAFNGTSPKYPFSFTFIQ